MKLNHDVPMMPENTKYRVFVGWDHAVVSQVQDAVVNHLVHLPCVRDVKGFGPKDTSIRVDYPDVAAEVCHGVMGGVKEDGLLPIGILICGSGIGQSIAANKIDGIRAALCHDYYTAEMARRHNNANVLCFGARVTGLEVCLQMISVFLATAFEDGPGSRHAGRVAKITALEGISRKAAEPAAAKE